VTLRPSKIFGIGLNYGPDALPEPALMYLKPASAVIGDGDDILLPRGQVEAMAEAELAVVIGRRCFDVDEEQALQYIAGFTCANDMTAIGLNSAHHDQVTAAKIADAFCPLGSEVTVSVSWEDRLITCYVNGRLAQSGSSSGYRFGPAAVVSAISRVCTLDTGDVVLLGSVSDPPIVTVGDTVTVAVEGIGSLTNRLVERLDGRGREGAR
jgi:2-keto-4-pentenoate hydratase/2-oxohepta-3-ene-1,7-dioic acid hydratase in catechol pathway